MSNRKDNKGRNLHTGESQRKDGTYMYRYTNERNGKRQTVYAKDLPKLRAKEKQLARDIGDNILTDSESRKLTVNELFETYMQTRVTADTTRTNYVKMWNNHIRDDIGNIKVVLLRSSDIKSFYAKLSRAGYRHSTIRLLHTLLCATLELAVDDDILRKNPAKRMLNSDYGAEAKKKEVLTVPQQDALMEFMRQSNIYNAYVPMITVMLETAVRCGELIGLTWADVDMEKRELSVDHQLIYKDYGDGNGYCFHAGTPKTDAGVRTIPLTQNACKAFAEQRKLNFMLGRRNEEEIDGYSDFVFLAKTGRPLMPSAVNNAIYNIIDAYNKQEVAKAKKEHRKAELIPRISAHSMRHTACSNMARKGMNVKVLQYLMGHANSDMTMDVYTHIAGLEDVKDEVARLETAI